MTCWKSIIVALLILSSSGVASAETAILLARNGASCKQVSSCEEAVYIWCNGYRRADADHDGIPCENICHSLEQVDAIRAAIGC